MNKIIDLRSDTVTQPTNEMRQVIANAELGDDVFQEDPTINKLENYAAKLLGKEAALLVPSGTMGNLASILAHCERGTEVILGDQSHTFNYEAGGISAFGGIQSRQLKNSGDGTIDLHLIKSAIRDDNVHFPKTSAIILENTHNRCYGSPLSIDYINSVAYIAKENGLKLHIDGARIFNATVALNVDIKEMVKNVDSITFCLSKGLAAPIGSVICGSNVFIEKARRNRKALGGGMRQAGIIAAAGIFALDKNNAQIKKDHQNTQKLAKGISQIKGLSIQLQHIKTNIIYFELDTTKISAKKLVDKMKKVGVKFFETSPNRFRLVTHYGITEKDIQFTLSRLNSIIM